MRAEAQAPLDRADAVLVKGCGIQRADRQVVVGILLGVERTPLDEGGPLVEHAAVHPADLRLEGFHPMGTARMGADHHTCVGGPSGESHEVPGLFVADASIFPTSLCVNPMVTVMACARRIARELAVGLR